MEKIKKDLNKKDNNIKKFARRVMLGIMGTGAAMGIADKAMSAEHTADAEFLKGGKDEKGMVFNKEESNKNEFIKNLETGSEMIKKSNEALQTRIDDVASDLSVLEKQKPMPHSQIATLKEKKRKLLDLQFREGGIDETIYQAEIDKLSE